MRQHSDLERIELKGEISGLHKSHAMELDELSEQHERSVSEMRIEYEETIRGSNDDVSRMRERIRLLETRLGSARDIIVSPLDSRR